ncbi:MAG: LUD domain-containing protein [Chloroflexota bacterium]|nr:LUD domain-containing protein [Chloroflexota bacterium]MBI5703439.1 LUD domain-containing protein [Chloroflexota bacterium]
MDSNQFRARIRKSLSNEALQAALDANAERRISGRVNAFASLPDWRERRLKAHAIRAEVIEHLDSYLEQFIQNATQNGITVHRAKGADEAIQIVLGIAKSLPQRREERQGNNEEISIHQRSSASPKILFAKSKSMVSEEINLNHALEAQGMRVVETDLGEYIIQLRNERPSHIITPAVHLRRHEVGQLFHEKLGVPYTDDIPTMTNTARKVLREVFLTADVGVSGVNFGVAETGGICIVTNEGNGRMVTSLPPVHIALMGMERLVRNFDDLALLLSLLPRSATGQKLSVYTQVIHQPLPGQRRHIIILDNGRSRLRRSPLRESLYCIRCGACLNACPVFREIGGHAYDSVYPGPIGSVISAGLFGSEFVPLAQASSLCGACKEACPVDIDLPKLLTRVRAGLAPGNSEQLSVISYQWAVGSGQLSVDSDQLSVSGGGLSWISRLFLKTYNRIATHPRLFALSQKFASLGTFLLSPVSDYVRLPAFTGWGYSKDLPRFAGRTFRERYTGRQVHTYTGRQVDRYTGTRVDKYTGKQVNEETLRIKDSAVAALPQRDMNRVKQFIEELTKVSGQVIRAGKEEVTNKVIEFLQDRGIRHIHLEPNVLNEDVLQQAGIIVSRKQDAGIRAGVTPHVSFRYSETCGVTKALCGLADTGSVLEADGEGDKLFASLLPSIHLVILDASDIYPSLKDALPLTRSTKSAVFITGPSRTGDIEMSHTIGVHGPGEVVVFLVDD